MIALPAAMYLVGARAGTGNADERPMHEAVLAAFALDRTEVTMKAYRACVDAGACKPPRDAHPFCNTRFSDRDDHPVNCIDWNDARAYCAFVHERLPTEAEWEYAASNGDEKRKYSWGEADPDTHNACYWHPGGTCAVASFAPGAFGLYDMSGNVWEWTSSVFVPYPDEPEDGRLRVYRGGSWSRRFPKWLRNQNRNRYRPDQWSASLGVRCARTTTPLVCPDEAAPKGDRCVRVRGNPRCEPGFTFHDGKCDAFGPRPAAEVVTAAAHGTTSDEHDDEHAVDPSLPGAPDEPITRARQPSIDADCAAHYAGHPSAWRFTGAGFWERLKVLEAAGCVRRDMGGRWTSACCK
jgi:hypothetical protein